MTADPKQPAYDAVFAYIRSQPDVVPATVVERNAMIWRAVHAALDAAPPAPAAGVQPPTTIQAHPTTTQWAVEVYDPRHSAWVATTRFHAPEVAADAVKDYEKTTPTWPDGSPVQHRNVRATTTYTVEPSEPLMHLPKGTNAEDCLGPPAAPAATEATP